MLYFVNVCAIFDSKLFTSRLNAHDPRQHSHPTKMLRIRQRAVLKQKGVASAPIYMYCTGLYKICKPSTDQRSNEYLELSQHLCRQHGMVLLFCHCPRRQLLLICSSSAAARHVAAGITTFLFFSHEFTLAYVVSAQVNKRIT